MKSRLHRVALITALGVIGQARAQQTVVPLDRFDDRVGITIGVNGGAAKEYLFDTGSDLFNIAIGSGPSPAWFPNYSGPKNQNSLTSYMYGDGTYGYLYGKTTISAIQFYASSTSQIPVSNGSFGPYTGGTLPAGAVVYDIATAAVLNEREQQQGILITNPDVTPNTFYQNLTWQNKLSAGTAPEEGKLYGTFGAGDFGDSILGRLTSTGYVVEANGTNTTPGGCGVACLVIGLTPELRAQFFSVVSWSSTKPPFPISGAPASDQYGVTFNYVLGSGTNTSSSKLATLLDTGYPGNEMNSAAAFNAQNGFGNLTSIKGTGGNYVVAGLSFNLTGDSAGAQTVAATTSGVAMKGKEVVSSDFLNTVQVSNKATNQAIAGLSFYTTNAVMYDLQNAAIGYTPFYVTVAPFTNGLAVSQDMGPLGVAGVISGQNGVAISPNAIAYLTAANTYTGATTVAQSAWLGVGGPGSIAASSNVAVDGTLDVFHSSNPQSIRSLSGGGAVVLGSTTLVLTAASGTFSGGIYNTYAAGSAAEPYPLPTESPQGYGGVIIAGGVETFSGDNGYAGKTGIGEVGGLDPHRDLAGQRRPQRRLLPERRPGPPCNHVDRNNRRRRQFRRRTLRRLRRRRSRRSPSGNARSSDDRNGFRAGLRRQLSRSLRRRQRQPHRRGGTGGDPGLHARRDLRHAHATRRPRAEFYRAHRLERHPRPVRRFQPQHGNANVAVSLPERQSRLCRGRRHDRSLAQRHPLRRGRADAQRIRGCDGPRHHESLASRLVRGDLAQFCYCSRRV